MRDKSNREINNMYINHQRTIKITSNSVAAQTPVKILLQTFWGLFIQSLLKGVEYPAVSKDKYQSQKGGIGHYIKINPDIMHAF